MEGTIAKYLPIGSVCLLKGGKVPVMVTGYMGMNQESKEVFDYMGVVYPIGIISTNITLMFNHEQIEKLEFKGFENEECKDMLAHLAATPKAELLKAAEQELAAGNLPEAPEVPAQVTAAQPTAAPAQTAAPVAPATPAQPAAPAGNDIFNNTTVN